MQRSKQYAMIFPAQWNFPDIYYAMLELYIHLQNGTTFQLLGSSATKLIAWMSAGMPQQIRRAIADIPYDVDDQLAAAGDGRDDAVGGRSDAAGDVPAEDVRHGRDALDGPVQAHLRKEFMIRFLSTVDLRLRQLRLRQ